MSFSCFLNGQPLKAAAVNDETFPAFDRALQFGDGFFETISIRQGVMPFWSYHLARIEKTALRLAIPLVEFRKQFVPWYEQYISAPELTGSLKIIFSSGSSPRGYKRSADSQSHWYVLLNDQLVSSPESIAVTVSQIPLSRSPFLAGLKHLNRLDQVMARDRLPEQYFEAVMLNIEGRPVEGIMSNLYWQTGDVLYTPCLAQEGVEGVVRAWLLQLAEQQNLPKGIKKVVVGDFSLAELARADVCFLSNALIGLRSVESLQCEGEAIVFADKAGAALTQCYADYYYHQPSLPLFE